MSNDNLDVWVGSIGTCVTGIALAILAWKQSRINQISQKIEIALRYQDHYIRLSEFIEKFNSDLDKYVNPLHTPNYECIKPMMLQQEAKQKHLLMLQLMREAQLSFLEDFQNDISKIKEISNDHILECYDKLANIITSSYADSSTIRRPVSMIVQTYKISDDIQDEILTIYKKYTEILRKLKSKNSQISGLRKIKTTLFQKVGCVD